MYDECGNLNYTSYKQYVRDTTAPQFDTEVKDVQYECDAEKPPTVCATDNCGNTTIKFSQVRENGSCEHDYTITRTWTAVDECGNPNTTTQIVTVLDDEKPKWNQSVPANYTTECTNMPEQEMMGATDNCDEIIPVMSNSTTPGGCAANYTQHFTWTASDACGNTREYTQNITVQDTQPPAIEAHPECIYPLVSKDFIPSKRYPNVTVTGMMFDFYDNCSSVSIEILSCKGSLDVENGYVQEGEEYSFSPDCIYDEYHDSIAVHFRWNWTKPTGIVFTVEAMATDACGHKTPARNIIWAPLDPSSQGDLLDEYPELADVTCGPEESNCPGTCECEYNRGQCTASGAPDVIVTRREDSAAFTTEFGWNARLATAGDKFFVDIPLSGPDGLQLIHAHPANFEIGTQEGSYLHGLAWTVGGGTTFKAKFAGIVSESEVFAQVLSPTTSSCTTVGLVSGPGSVTGHNPAHNEVVGGNVRITGVREGVDRSALIPLEGVIVYLIDDTGMIVRMTGTDREGNFLFSHVPAPSTPYRVAIGPEGLLRDVPRSSGKFLWTDSHEDSVYKWGLPKVATLNTANHLDVLFDNQEAPVYDRNRHDRGDREDLSYNGISRSAGFWSLQDKIRNNQVSNDGLWYSPQKTNWAFADANSDFQCSETIDAALLDGPASDLKVKLAVALLNRAAGDGLMEPYKLVQDWTIAYVNHVACATSGPIASDEAMAHELIDRINGAW